MNEFGKLPQLKYKNVKLIGLFEKNVEPIEVIINASFFILPAKELHEEITIYDYRSYIKNNKFGYKVLKKEIDKLNFGNINWKIDNYCGINYTYNHSIDDLNFNEKNTSMGIDFLFITEHKKSDIYEYKKLKKEYLIAANCIGNLSNFLSDSFVIIKPSK